MYIFTKRLPDAQKIRYNASKKRLFNAICQIKFTFVDHFFCKTPILSLSLQQNFKYLLAMKKTVFTLILTAAALTGCTQKAAQTTEEITQEVSLDGAVATLSDGTVVTWLKDNAGDRLMPRSLFPEAPDSLIEALGLQEGIPASVSTFLMKADGKWILFDAGLGEMGHGQTIAGMAELGLTPDSISELYITHFHGDHIGGMVADGKPVFANAEVYTGAVEYKAWIEEMPEEKNGLQRAAMEAYKEHLHLFEFGDTLTHGIVALDAVGHTPGHTAFEKGELLIIGDLMHGAALQLEHPEFSGNYDMDKAQAAASRERLINYAKEKHLIMAGMHLPEPAFIAQ